MKQSYYINTTRMIESDENGNFGSHDLALALVALGGWTIHEPTALGDTLITRMNPGAQEVTRFVPSSVDIDTIEKHAQTYGLHPIMPLQDLEFSQMLMTAFPCVITPIISHGGELRGLWRVESLSGWQAADLRKTGLRHGTNEFIESVSTVLPEAIGLNALSRAGIGKQAYFYYPDMRVEDAELIYMGQRSLNVISMDAMFMLHLVPAPALDAYAMVPPPDDVLEDQRTLADAQAVIQKAELKAILDAQKTEEVNAVEEVAPELVEEPAQVEEPEQAEPEVKPESV